MPYDVQKIDPSLPALASGVDANGDPAPIASVPLDGLARMLGEYFDSATVKGLIAAPLEVLQDLETSSVGCLLALNLGAAVGAQLDLLGTIAQETRRGRSDTTYRIAIRTRIRTNRSQGQADDLVEVAAIFLDVLPGAGAVDLEEGFAAVTVSTNEETTNPVGLMRFLVDAKAAGVSLRLSYWPLAGDPEALAFTFSETYATEEEDDLRGLASEYATVPGGAFRGMLLSSSYDPTVSEVYTTTLLTLSGLDLETLGGDPLTVL